TLLFAAAQLQQRAGQNNRRKIRLQRQRAAERIHDDHAVDGAAADAAVFFRERQSKQAELCILLPQLAREAVGLPRIGLQCLEAILVGEQAIDAVLEQLLLVAQLKIHDVS